MLLFLNLCLLHDRDSGVVCSICGRPRLRFHVTSFLLVSLEGGSSGMHERSCMCVTVVSLGGFGSSFLEAGSGMRGRCDSSVQSKAAVRAAGRRGVVIAQLES